MRMNAKEVLEGNKLIARFMGVEQMFDYKVSPPEPLPIYWIGYQIHESELDYDSDWSRLMPVVEKVETLKHTHDNGITTMFDVVINREGVCIDGYSSRDFCFGNKKESIYRAVVDFIKWYNENKSPLTGNELTLQS